MFGVPLYVVVLGAVAAAVLRFSYALYRVRSRYAKLVGVMARLFGFFIYSSEQPGPPHSFLWGHLPIMGKVTAQFPPNMHPQWAYTTIAREYNLKGVFYMDLWPFTYPQCIINDPDVMSQLWIKRALPVHQVAEELLAPMLGPNVIASANGPVWKSLHHAMAPAFSWSHIRSLTDVMVDEGTLFRRNLDRLSKTGEVFSMEDLSAKLIFDVITRVVFNYSLNSQTETSQELLDLQSLVVLANARLGSFNPYVLVKSYLQCAWVSRRVDATLRKKVVERYDLLLRDKVVPSRKNPLSIVDLMLRDKLQLAEAAGKDSAPQISDAEMKLLLTNIKGLLLGGHGTTTDTLCYAYMLLSKNPDVVRKLREEHTTVFGAHLQSGLDVVLEDPVKLDELHYTNAVILETLRLFPVGFSVRGAAKGDTVFYDGQQYPVDEVCLCANMMDWHYNDEFYPEPARFNPDRFLAEDERKARHNMRTFSRGARACLGQNLAVTELKVILLMTVRDYDFECAGLKPNSKPKSNFTDIDTIYGDIVLQELGIEAKPRGGMMMTVRRTG